MTFITAGTLRARALLRDGWVEIPLFLADQLAGALPASEVRQIVVRITTGRGRAPGGWNYMFLCPVWVRALAAWYLPLAGPRYSTPSLEALRRAVRMLHADADRRAGVETAFRLGGVEAAAPLFR